MLFLQTSEMSPSSVAMHSTDKKLFLYIRISASSAAILLAMVIVVTTVTVFLCWRKKKKSAVNKTSNTASGPSSSEFCMTANIAHDEDYIIRPQFYSYATQPTIAVMTPNSAYSRAPVQVSNAAESVPATSHNIPAVYHDTLAAGDATHDTSETEVELCRNVAYRMHDTSETEVELCRNVAYRMHDTSETEVELCRNVAYRV